MLAAAVHLAEMAQSCGVAGAMGRLALPQGCAFAEKGESLPPYALEG